jgi:hypothetical protein
MNTIVEVVPRDEFGSCSVRVERAPSGAVWLSQNDMRIYVGPEHVIALADEIMRTRRLTG